MDSEPMKSIIASVLTVLAAAFTCGQGLFGNDTQAFVLMPAQAIASASTLNIDIAPFGRHILYQQVTVGTPESLFANPKDATGKWFVYDRIAKASKQINLPQKPSALSLLADDQNIYFETHDPEPVKGFLNLSNGLITTINTKDAEMIYWGASEYAKCLIGIAGDTLVAFFPNGTVKTATLDPKLRIMWLMAGDANSLIFMARPADKSRRQIKANLNRANFTMTYGEFKDGEMDNFRSMSNQKRPMFQASPSGEMDYVSIFEEKHVPSATISGIGATAKPQKKEESKSLVPTSTRLGPVGGEVIFSLRNDFVVYQDAGALLIREIKPIDRLLAEKLSFDDLKKKLLNKAKQCGLGFIIYGSDNDDILPGAEGWENKLMPYMKDRNMMRDFNYSFRGGDVSKVVDPANTELGFVVGPGGRAVVYVDGHAKWVPNP